MGRYKNEPKGVCLGHRPHRFLTYSQRTKDRIEELFPSSKLFSRMQPKHIYVELQDTKDEEGNDSDVSVSKSAGKLKRKAVEGGSNNNASGASSFGLAEGDGERALKVAKRLLATSQGRVKKCE